MFVSRGSVCLLPYVHSDANDETKMAALVRQLSRKVMTLVSKVCQIVNFAFPNFCFYNYFLTTRQHCKPVMCLCVYIYFIN